MVELAQRLIAADSSNPPGDERAGVQIVVEELQRAGLDPKIVVKSPGRPNVVARVPGRGEARPLLLYGHVDVVPASGQWRHPPFSGELVDGEVWGRGALDMKGGLAMLVAAVTAATRASTPPPGDLIFAATSGEETGGVEGASFLVGEHAELFGGVRHAISEFGGYTQHVGSRRLYPIQIAQKGRCLLRLTVRGDSGHSANVGDSSAVGRLATTLGALQSARLPVHLTPVVGLMIREMAKGLPASQACALRAMLRPRLTKAVLRAAGEQAQDLQPLLRNTAVATVVRAGEATNVTPDTATATLDGRLVPGHDARELVDELRVVLPAAVELQVLEADPPQRLAPNLELVDLLSAVLREEDPGGYPFPLVTPGMTDARHFDRLGIQSYGCLPMRLPPGLMPTLLHAPNERVPATALTNGAAALGRIINRYQKAA